MLQVYNLSKSYGHQTLFSDATFTVNARERIGLVGRNGHGKTTLFKLIVGEEEPDSGSIKIPKGYRVGQLSQQIVFSEETIFAEACKDLPLNEEGWREDYKAEIALHGLGFDPEDFQKKPELLSGGFQVRLNLAKLLVSEPDLLLLDEPTNYLDIVSLRWLARFLRNWPGELIIITHDRSFMDSVTTHTLGIHREKMRKVQGSTEKLYTLLAEEEEHFEKTRQNKLKQRERTEAFIRRFRAKASKARQAQSKIKALEREGPLEELREIENLDFKFNAAPFQGKQVLECKTISFRYCDKDDYLIKDLSFEVGKNDRICIIGKNGKGKSTLLNLIAGELNLQEGDCRSSPNVELGFFGQTNIERLDPEKTIEEELLASFPDCSRTLARTICGHMMFEGDLALKKISVLSGGEKSRVQLGKVLLSPANLLLLDEPTNHLDMYACDSFGDALSEFPGAVLLVTHDEDLLREIATRLIIFDRNKVHFFNGTYDEFLEKIGWESEDEIRSGQSVDTTLSKKEKRKLKAALKEKRSELLGPLEARIKKIEREIGKLEKTIERQNEELLQGTIEGYSNEMAKLSRQLHQNKQARDSLYKELEKVMEEHEMIEKELLKS